MSPERPLAPLITISAAYGAGGSIVGPRLAKRMGVPFLDRAIPVAVSTRLSVPVDEVLESEVAPHTSLGRLVEQFAPAVATFPGTAPVIEPIGRDERLFLTETEQVLRESASRGCVILGRAAAVVLREFERGLHVRLDGPRERRILQAMRVRGIDRSTAEEELRAADLSREAYARHWYRVDPRDPGLYHVMIDSTAIDLGTCVQMIVLAAEKRLQRPL